MSLIVTVFVLVIVALVLTVLFLPFHRSTPSTRSARDARAAATSPPATEREAAAPPPDTKREAAASRRGAEPDVAALFEEKERVLQALADLRFDFEAGKLSREDFEEEDARLRERAAALLRELDDSNG